MLRWILVLLLMATGATAQESPRAMVKFIWGQPQMTTSGQTMADGWMKEYKIYLAAEGDTVYYGYVPAPEAIADSCLAYVSLKIGVPTAIQVEGINRWGVAGPERSEWSDTHIVIPDPPVAPGKPGSRK